MSRFPVPPFIIEPGDEHPLQYAFVQGLQPSRDPIVYGTENLDDAGVFKKVLDWAEAHPGELTPGAVHMLQHWVGYAAELHVERYNRCPECEQWSPCDIRKARATIGPP